MALPANLAYRLLNQHKPAAPKPLAPNTAYGMLNTGTTTPITSHQGDTPVPTPTTTNQDAGGAPSVNPTYTPTIDPFVLAQANDAYSRAVNSVNSGRQGLLSKYGYKATGFDDTGNAVGLDVDPNSLFGSFQQLLQQQAGDAMTAEDNATGRGFSGTGLGNQELGADKYTWGAQDLDLGSSLQQGLGQFGQQLLQAKTDKDNAIYQGNLDAINTAILNGDFGTVTDNYVPPDPLVQDNTSATTTVNNTGNIQRPSVKGNTVLWNNQYMNAQKLANTLAKQGVSTTTWVTNHPAAAKAIGLKVPTPPKPKKRK